MYKIVGADQKEYGPVTEEQLRQWISEGRANAQTLVRFGDAPWKPLSTFPEFATALGIVLPTPPLEAPPGMNASASSPPPLTFGSLATTPPAPTSGMAIAGFTCSILGLVCCGCGPIFSTLGLVLSAVALSQISKDPSKYSGRGLAMAGIIIALVGYVLFGVLFSTHTFQRRFRRFPRYF
jgi:hypothetical protein